MKTYYYNTKGLYKGVLFISKDDFVTDYWDDDEIKFHIECRGVVRTTTKPQRGGILTESRSIILTEQPDGTRGSFLIADWGLFSFIGLTVHEMFADHPSCKTLDAFIAELEQV